MAVHFEITFIWIVTDIKPLYLFIVRYLLTSMLYVQKQYLIFFFLNFNSRISPASRDTPDRRGAPRFPDRKSRYVSISSEIVHINMNHHFPLYLNSSFDRSITVLEILTISKCWWVAMISMLLNTTLIGTCPPKVRLEVVICKPDFLTILQQGRKVTY